MTPRYKTICLYSSPVHVSAIRPLERFLPSTPYNICWSKAWEFRETKVRGEHPKADVYVTVTSGHYTYKLFDWAKTIHIPHGLSPAELGCIAEYPIKQFKGALLPGQWYLDKIKEGQYYEKRGDREFTIKYRDYPEDFFKIVGWMKGDVLFSSRIDEIVKQVKDTLNIKLPYEKTILYAPTGYWGVGYCSFPETIHPLIKIAKQLEMNLIIKLHYGTVKKDTEVIYNRVKQISKYMNNVTWIAADALEDISPLYKIADVLISDASSTALEFLQVDKIAIEMTNRKVPIQSEWRGYLFPAKSTVKCKDIKKLKDVITKVIYFPRTYRKQIKRWKERLIYRPNGKATKRVVKAIESIMGWK